MAASSAVTWWKARLFHPVSAMKTDTSPSCTHTRRRAAPVTTLGACGVGGRRDKQAEGEQDESDDDARHRDVVSPKGEHEDGCEPHCDVEPRRCRAGDLLHHVDDAVQESDRCPAVTMMQLAFLWVPMDGATCPGMIS